MQTQDSDTGLRYKCRHRTIMQTRDLATLHTGLGYNVDTGLGHNADTGLGYKCWHRTIMQTRDLATLQTRDLATLQTRDYNVDI